MREWVVLLSALKGPRSPRATAWPVGRAALPAMKCRRPTRPAQPASGIATKRSVFACGGWLMQQAVVPRSPKMLGDGASIVRNDSYVHGLAMLLSF